MWRVIPTYPMREEFTVKRSITYQNSFGQVGPDYPDVEFNVIVSVNDERKKGWWQIDGGGGAHYASGGLWFDDNRKLTDYDGIFSLPDYIGEKLEEHGYDVGFLN